MQEKLEKYSICMKVCMKVQIRLENKFGLIVNYSKEKNKFWIYLLQHFDRKLFRKDMTNIEKLAFYASFLKQYLTRKIVRVSLIIIDSVSMQNLKL